MGKVRAFTLIETLSVMAIVAVLAALLFPVGARAIQQAKLTQEMGKLRQLHVAVKLYQSDYDGDGKYGKPADMGLIERGDFFNDSRYLAYSKEMELWESSCGKHPSVDFGPPHLGYFPTFEEEWIRVVAAKQELAPLFVDPNCADPSVHIYSRFERKRSLGVRLDGSISAKTHFGAFMNYWLSPE